ncbi:MAG TPA: TetR/AcrR family transcriptional regulator [Limnochordia bacterium]|nr:TetR/AcrR family transcriptional regulator [Limnochordia bacterium]
MVATLELLADQGFAGTSTKAISQRAQVNESTVFRHFGTKRDLVIAALDTLTRPLLEVVPPPSDRVRDDLLALATGYQAVIMSLRGVVVRTLHELMRDEELRQKGIGRHLQVFITRAFDLFRHHQRAGYLKDDEAPEQMALAFIGPLYTRAMLVHMWAAADAFDAVRYTEAFLSGRQPRPPE